jgi:Uma2 family endonuclease
MRAVIPNVPPAVLAWRKQIGADRWDEMWDGVLHMAPSPNREHLDLEWAIETFLRLHWAPSRGARVYHNINVAEPDRWPHNYRIPDLILLLPDRFEIDRNEYFEGGPNVVGEIRSPGDESYEKLEFYARIGISEVWIIDRDSKAPEIYLLSEGRYLSQPADADGWIQSPATGIELKRSETGKLAIRLAGNETTRQDLP